MVVRIRGWTLKSGRGPSDVPVLARQVIRALSQAERKWLRKCGIVRPATSHPSAHHCTTAVHASQCLDTTGHAFSILLTHNQLHQDHRDQRVNSTKSIRPSGRYTTREASLYAVSSSHNPRGPKPRADRRAPPVFRDPSVSQALHCCHLTPRLNAPLGWSCGTFEPTLRHGL